MTESRIDLHSALRHHGPMLMRVARALVSDEHAAADLVQDTWATALRARPKPLAGAGGGLKAWLLTTMRNHARSAHRKSAVRTHDAERGARETAPKDLEALSTSQTAERLEAERLVHGALSDLEEPLRTTLVLRFHDGLSAAAIGKQMGVPGSTVRSRQQKGIELLRQRLDAQFGGDGEARAAWGAALLPLTKLTKGGAAKAAGGGGVLLAGKLAAAAAVLGAASLGAVEMLSESRPEALEPVPLRLDSSGSDPGPLVFDAGRRRVATASAVSGSEVEAESAAALPSASPAETGPYLLVVNGEGEPQPGFPIKLADYDNGSRGPESQDKGARTDGEGRLFLLDPQGERVEGRLRIANAPLVPMVSVELPTAEALAELSSEAVRMVVPDTGSVTVRLTDEAGLPWSEGARIRIGAPRVLDPEESFGPVSWVDIEGGSYTFAQVGVGSAYEVYVEQLGEWRSKFATYPALAKGESRAHEFSIEEQWPVLVGRAVDVRGRPLPAIRLRLQLDGAYGSATCDAQGEFRLPIRGNPEELGGVRGELKGAIPGQIPSLEGQLTIPLEVAAGDVEVGDVGLVDSACTVAGSIRMLDGRPAGGHSWIPLIQEVSPGRWEPAEITFMPGLDGRFFCRDDVADTSRALAIDLLTPLFAHGERYFLDEPVRFERGARNVEVVLTTPAVKIRGRVVAPEGIRGRDLRVRLLRAGMADQIFEGDSFHDWTRQGTVDVEVGVHYSDEPLVRILGVNVLSDGVTDSRLEGIVIPPEAAARVRRPAKGQRQRR